MKTLVGVLVVGFSLFAQSASAGVTPASHALQQVKAYLDAEVEREAYAVIPHHKAASHLVQFRSNLMRGKFSDSPGGFSDYFGTTELMLNVGFSDTYYEVTCTVSAKAMVVPFAKQMVPILEEIVNQEQLVLKRHRVSCSVN